MTAARLHNVSRRYGRRWALVRVSYEVPAGSAVLLSGGNGAGKTTLLRVLATALKPTRGTLEIFGQPASQQTEVLRPRIGLVTHDSHLYEDLSAAENLYLACTLKPDLERARVPGLLERVGLAGRAHSAVRTFSAGMRRRLCIARLLLRQPDLVLLDEPFGQLDPEGVTLTEQIIGELREARTTLVIATHDIDRGRALCDRRLHLAAGRVTEVSDV
jgi:heme exporter protein A